MKKTPLVRKTSLKPQKAAPKKKAKGKSSCRTAPTTKQVDVLWSLVIRERAANECQMYGCGNRLCGGPLNAHHIVGRGMAVRWRLDNGLALCWTHHLHYVHNGNHQAAAQEDIREIVGPDLYAELVALHHTEGKNSAAIRREVYASLKAELDRLKAAA